METPHRGAGEGQRQGGAQQPITLCPLLLSVQRPRGETQGVLTLPTHKQCAYNELQLSNPCPFTSPRLSCCLASCQFREQRSQSPLLREPGWVLEEVAMGVSTGWPLCGPPCLPIHGGLVPTATPSHIWLPTGWCILPQHPAGPHLCPGACAHGACIQGDLGKLQHLHIKTQNVRLS